MSDEQVNVVENIQKEVKNAEQKQEEHISIDPGTAFSLKIQEFDKKIAESEFVVASIKKEKMCFIYDQNVQQIVLHHKEKTLKAQIEEETKKKLSSN